MPERSLASIDADAAMNVLAINALGPVLMTQAVAPQLSRGAIVANLSARVRLDWRQWPRRLVVVSNVQGGSNMATMNIFQRDAAAGRLPCLYTRARPTRI